MLTFSQLENYYRLITAIARCEKLVKDNGLRGQNYQTTPHAKGVQAHKTEDQVLSREKALMKLPLLKAKQEHNLPLVKDTIEKATAGCKPSVQLKRQMVFQMRYIHGREWVEIEDLLKIHKPDQLVQNTLLTGSEKK